MKFYGADYYPEQETQEDIIKDAERMEKQGFNAVRIGEFAWSLFEPTEGCYQTEWFLKVINILGEYGIHTVVCTPTACPPIWLVKKHPEILYRDCRGNVRPFGGRRYYCYNNDIYREYCRKIAGMIAKAIIGNQYVIGIHIDNELAQEATGRCHCDICAEKFRSWLKNKYKTIENFNQKAGTVFWNQTYMDFSEINMPITSIEPQTSGPIEPYKDNPTLMLEYERFCSESMVDFVNVQTDEISKYTNIPKTTNTTAAWTNGVNYFEAFKKLDIVSVDEYPLLRHNDLYSSGFSYGFMRGIKGKKDFWVVETSSGGGASVWVPEGVPQPFPGTLKQAAVHAFVNGADLFTYFQYKTFRFGAEQLEAAVLDIDEIERRKNVEMRDTSKLICELKEVLENTELICEAAVCYDYDSLWALKIKTFHKNYSYPGYIMYWHSILQKSGVQADVIPLDKSIFKYRMIILPTTVILSNVFKKELKEYVKNGGIVIASFLLSIKNIYNTADRVSNPSGLTDLFGLRVGECDAVRDGMNAKINLRLSNSSFDFVNSLWTESLETDTAKSIAEYTDTYRQGETVAAVNRYGKGKAYYIGTNLSENAGKFLIKDICKEESISNITVEFPDGVECFERKRKDKKYCFIFNSREDDVEVILKGCFTDILSGDIISQKNIIKSKEIIILEEKE